MDLQPTILGPNLIQLLLTSAEAYVRRAPSDGTSRLVLSVWESLLKRHTSLSSRPVFESVLRLLDFNGRDLSIKAEGSEGERIAEADRSVGLGFLTCVSHDWGAIYAVFAVRPDAVWELHGLEQRPNLSQVRGALARLRRLGCWFLGQYNTLLPRDQAGVVFIRLQTLALYADYLTRCAAVAALCKIATLTENVDMKLAVYEFLHSIEVAEFDLNICPDVQVRSNLFATYSTGDSFVTKLRRVLVGGGRRK